MAGLLFLIILGFWFWGALSLAKLSTRRMQVGGLRKMTTIFATVFFFLLPLADEIIGGFQFRALCEQAEATKSNGQRIAGKTVRADVNPSNKDIAGTPIRIYHSHVIYRDVKTGEALADYKKYVAEGGWFVRVISLGYFKDPIAIHPKSCSTAAAIDSDFKKTN
jgi:hypothetical protein